MNDRSTQISNKSQQEENMDNKPILSLSPQGQIYSEISSSFGRSNSSQLEFEPNEADEQKRFGCKHLEVEGKIYTGLDVKNLLAEMEEMKTNLSWTRKCCSVLRKQLKDERRKCKIRREDFRLMHGLLQRYSDDQN